MSEHTISNSTIQNAAVSVGNNNSVINHIELLPDNHDLKLTLEELKALLSQSQLSAIKKQEASNSVNDLAKFSQHEPKSERLDLAERSFTYLEKLNSVGELGLKYGELLSKIVSYF